MISKIFHIADIHIRPFKRHNEYELVFKRLYQYIEQNRDDDSVIFLGGDIVHNKTDMSPELIRVTSNFFKNCADLCPTILICGNHDANLSNSNRLDALTPIVDSLQHPQLHYWKNSGVYKLKGVSFSVYSLLQPQSTWISADKIKSKTKIALYHGAVNSAKTDAGFEISGRAVDISMFNGFDLVLLGDIHTFQYLNDKKTIAYPSSLICQNFGESPRDHGIIVWDVPTKSSKFIEIQNDWCYYTLQITNGYYEIPKNLPRKVRLRVKYDNTRIDIVNEAIEKFGSKYQIIETIKQKTISERKSHNDNIELGNSRDVAYQTALILEYLESIGVHKSDIELVQRLNYEFNTHLGAHNIRQHDNWIPMRLEFSNMFSYGENNVIEFNSYSGVVGICAGNGMGKSALLDILCFTLFDKSTRASKGAHIMNSAKDKFNCKLEFQIHDTRYTIERIGTRFDTGAVRVSVNFYMIDDAGNTVLLNGEDRDSTNKIIRQYIGTYDDFVMTALSTQYDNHNFVEKSQRDRKELLYRLLDISIYEDLHRLAKDKNKENEIFLKELQKEDLPSKLSNIRNRLGILKPKIDEQTQQINEIDETRKKLRDEISTLSRQIHPITEHRRSPDVIRADINSLTNSLTDIVNKIEIQQSKLIHLGDLIEIQPPELSDQSIEINRLINQKTKVSQRLSQYQSTKNHLVQQIDMLSTHEYDPNCQFCIQNQFVMNAEQAKNELPNVNIEIAKCENEIETISINLDKLNSIQDMFKHEQLTYQQYLSRLTERQSITSTVDKLKNQGISVRSELSSRHAELDQSQKFNNIIEANTLIDRDISLRTNELDKLDGVYKSLSTSRSKLMIDVKLLSKEYETIQIQSKRMEQIESELKIYNLYIQSTSKEGIPYLILNKVLPVIEHEVNDMLSQVVNFTVRIEPTDEKYIHAYMINEQSKWPVELTSGMERFILSLSFRCALNEITSLPKPNFLAIDEGFGVLDSDNLMWVGRLFEYLKSRYDYLLIITHIESMKDLLERRIDIERANGHSKILVNYD